MKALRKFWSRLTETREADRLRRENVGTGSKLSFRTQVYGWKSLRVGKHTVICEDTMINALNCPRDEPTVRIGDFCFIGRRNFLNAGESLVISDYCLTGNDCHFLGSDHVHASPFVPYITSGNTLGESCRLGPNVWLGARVTVMKGVQIGFGSIIGAASLVTRDVPPLSIAAGSPARVIKRFDTVANAWVAAEEFPADGESHFPTEEKYLADLREKHPFIRMPLRAIGGEFGDL